MWVSTSFLCLDSGWLNGQFSPLTFCVVSVWTSITPLQYSQRHVHLSWRHLSIDLNPVWLQPPCSVLTSLHVRRQNLCSLALTVFKSCCWQTPDRMYLLSIHSTTIAWLMQCYWDVCPFARSFSNFLTLSLGHFNSTTSPGDSNFFCSTNMETAGLLGMLYAQHSFGAVYREFLGIHALVFVLSVSSLILVDSRHSFKKIKWTGCWNVKCWCFSDGFSSEPHSSPNTMLNQA